MAIDPQTIQTALAEKSKEYGTRIADVAKLADTYNPATDPEVVGLRNNQAEKLKELFAHDQQLADVKFQPQAAPGGDPGPVPEQRLIDPTIGMRAASTQTQSIGNELSDILKRIETRKDSLSMERAKASDMIDILLKANQNEQSLLEKQMDWYFKMRDQERADRESGGKAGETLAKKQEKSKIAKFFADINMKSPDKNKANAEQTARLLIAEGYDPDLVYEIKDQMVSGYDEAKEDPKITATKDLVSEINNPNRPVGMTKQQFALQAHVLYPELTPQEINNMVNKFWIE